MQTLLLFKQHTQLVNQAMDTLLTMALCMYGVLLLALGKMLAILKAQQVQLVLKV
jgi:hypothetical protein